MVEHPARLMLDDASALKQWKPAYQRGAAMQASLAFIAGLLGIASWWRAGEMLWLAGAVLMLANWPYTLLIIMPTNSKLKAITPEATTAEIHPLMLRWGKLHGARSLLGALSLVAYLSAAA